MNVAGVATAAALPNLPVVTADSGRKQLSTETIRRRGHVPAPPAHPVTNRSQVVLAPLLIQQRRVGRPPSQEFGIPVLRTPIEFADDVHLTPEEVHEIEFARVMR